MVYMLLNEYTDAYYINKSGEYVKRKECILDKLFMFDIKKSVYLNIPSNPKLTITASIKNTFLFVLTLLSINKASK